MGSEEIALPKKIFPRLKLSFLGSSLAASEERMEPLVQKKSVPQERPVKKSAKKSGAQIGCTITFKGGPVRTFATQIQPYHQFSVESAVKREVGKNPHGSGHC